MFLRVHHITHVVRSASEMAEYLEKNFGLKPAHTGDKPDAGFKFLLYQVGPTMMDFFEPTRADSGYGRALQERGPGVHHVSWAVQGIDKVFQDLKRKGVGLRAEGPSTSAFGYKTIGLPTSDSQGITFQLSEGEMTDFGPGR